MRKSSTDLLNPTAIPNYRKINSQSTLQRNHSILMSKGELVDLKGESTERLAEGSTELIEAVTPDEWVPALILPGCKGTLEKGRP